MSTMGITVRFPLGVYQGHRADGSPDPFPDPLRLQSALLNAAAVGTNTVDSADGISTKALEALHWLENNPPVGLRLPEHQWVGDSKGIFAYRKVSSINAKHRVESRSISDGVAMESSIGYSWESVPSSVIDTVEELIADVPYLGEAQSLAVLELNDVTPTVTLAEGMSPFDAGGMRVGIALPGRTEYLRDSFNSQYPKKLPTAAKDKFKSSELPLSAPKTDKYCGVARYIPVEEAEVDSPWTSAILLDVSGPIIPRKDRVEFCTAVHKAIVKAIGYGASSFATGKYLNGETRPTNRLAIQYLPGDLLRRFATPALGLRDSKIALMIPKGANPLEVQELAFALTAVNRVWTRSQQRSLRFTGEVVQTKGFWAVGQRTSSTWRTEMPVVPETRPVSSKHWPTEWTLGDAGLLSVGFVWKNQLPYDGGGESRYVALRNAAESNGAKVLSARSQVKDPLRFIHKLPRGVTARPWNGLIDLGAFADPTELIAIGQSRHLGGGLLVPTHFDSQSEESE